MDVHKNARLTPFGRERIVLQIENGLAPKAVGEAAGVCPRTVRKWVDRYRREGLAGLRDRSSRPHRLHRPTPQPVVEQVEALRRQRRTGKQIAAELRISSATVESGDTIQKRTDQAAVRTAFVVERGQPDRGQ